MPRQPRPIRWMADRALCVWLASIAIACDSSGGDSPSSDEGTGGAPSGGDPSGGSPSTETPPATGGVDSPVLVLDGSVGDAQAECTSTVTCTPVGGIYCGEIGDGCGQNMDCGSCADDWICEKNVCVGGPSCEPAACQTATTRFCGQIGDGCGHTLECGDCAAGESCTGGVCVEHGCVPLSCDHEHGRFCGTIGDGCGATLECGDCPGGGICGGGGVDHLCWDPSCVQAECTGVNGGKFCGVIGDGCGGIRDCGSCADSWLCEENVCVGDPSCTPFTCQSGDTRFCGTFGDGCGRSLDCGDCGDEEHCELGICIANSCVPLSCDSSAARYCGEIGDGCGRSLDCGDCPNDGACGGGSLPNVCIDPACTPKGCVAENDGVYCGVIGDGCGGVLECDTTCPNDEVCGAEIPNVCPGTGTGCINLQCQVRTDCPDGTATSLSGIVYDPAGVNPIYNALVYVPNAALDPIPTGATCEQCGAIASGQALASALTDATGHFTLTNVPSGADIPLVIQVGKWRRQVTIPSVTDCIDNPISDRELTRLPRTKDEGSIPQIAVVTGVRDSLECLLRTIGIADSEFTTDGGPGRVHLYYGGNLDDPPGGGVGASRFDTSLNDGAAFSSAATLWSSTEKMLTYDIQLYSCEGGGMESHKTPYRPNFLAYVNGGGRAFLSHYHYYWLQQEELVGTANYIGSAPDLPQGGITAFIDTSFPKAEALADWLVNVGVSPRGELEILEGQHSVAGVHPPTQEWIYVPTNPNDDEGRRSTQYMTFNTPVTVPEDSQCGRVVFTDLHVAAGEGAISRDPTAPFPTGCSADLLTAQGKALEFLFFDLSSCIEPPEVIPVPPPPPDIPPVEPPPATTAPPSPPTMPPPPTDSPPLSEIPPIAPPPPPPPPPPEVY
ncbi:MAG: carboxypeptidase regulatory-like domain-containing protein [Polyangiaceae bacterium]|nr:carboxypeptidase regulatory-like domain-containing protein [Polyangiaceae bacterium]